MRGKTERVDSPLQARALLAELRALGAQAIAQKPIPGHGAGVFCFATAKNAAAVCS